MDWKPDYVLNCLPMDETHQAFVACVDALEKAEGEAVLPCLDALIEHTLAHFEQENHWMTECQFPPILCHTGEHERVLKALREMRPTLEADPAVAKILVKELEGWFADHAASMDDALAFFMRQAGYTPVALSAEAS